mgnify:CR=1 FL=1
MLSQLLCSLGLTEKESAIYLALLNLGASKSVELARYTGFTRPTIYDLTEKLVRRGLVSKYKKKHITTFNALDPQKLIQYLDSELNEFQNKLNLQKKQVQDLLPVLQSLQLKNTTKPKVQFFEGEKGMREAYEDTLTSSDKILAYTNVEAMTQALPNFFPYYFQRRAAKKIPVDAIFVQNEGGRERASQDQTELRRTKFFPGAHIQWSPEVKIYNNKILIASWQEKMAVIIESKEFADLQRIIFQKLWESLR